MDKEEALSRSRGSYEIYERAGELIPGRTQLRSRLASGFAEGVSPVYAAHAKGSRFVDVDGHSEDTKVAKAIAKLSETCSFVKILGSYPNSG